MKQLKASLLPLFIAIAFLGCATKGAYNTLYSVEKTTTAAYDGFLAAVVEGTAKTNAVPQVSADFDRFQIGMRVAVVAAQMDKNSLAPSNVVHLSEIVLHSILEAKAR